MLTAAGPPISNAMAHTFAIRAEYTHEPLALFSSSPEKDDTMTKKALWRAPVGKSLILGSLLALTLPGIAYANTVSVTVVTPGTTSEPSTSFSEISPHADCDEGDLISGGGINQAIGTGSSSNGNHVNGTVPSIDGTTELISTPGVVATDVAYWTAFTHTGGGSSPGTKTDVWAVCVDDGV